MNNIIWIYSILLIIFEVVTLVLSYKFKGLKFTTYTFLFRISFISLLVIYLYTQKPLVIALAMVAYFIINFFQDIFFHRCYYTKLNRWLLINYSVAFLIGLVMIAFKLYFYTIFLNLTLSIVGVLISAKSNKH